MDLGQSRDQSYGSRSALVQVFIIRVVAAWLCDGWFGLWRSWPPALGVSRATEQASPRSPRRFAGRNESPASAQRRKARSACAKPWKEGGAAAAARAPRGPPTPAPAPVAAATTIPSRVELRRRAGLPHQ